MAKKVIGINLLLFVVYVILINISSSVADKGFNIAIGMGVCMVIHVLLNVISGVFFFVINKSDLGKSLLLSAAVLVPLGFCTWLILLSIFG
ncbi:MAG: hypothetical protein V4721_09450 [Bacteroidota bacterium]